MRRPHRPLMPSPTGYSSPTPDAGSLHHRYTSRQPCPAQFCEQRSEISVRHDSDLRQPSRGPRLRRQRCYCVVREGRDAFSFSTLRLAIDQWVAENHHTGRYGPGLAGWQPQNLFPSAENKEVNVVSCGAFWHGSCLSLRRRHSSKCGFISLGSVGRGGL